MVNSEQDYGEFVELNKNADLFLHIILTCDILHPVLASPSIIFIQNINTGVQYPICISHQDGVYTVDLDKFRIDIAKFTGRIFVLNKKDTFHHLPIPTLLDLNLGLQLENKKLIEPVEYETPAHKFIRRVHREYNALSRVIPLVKHMEMVHKIFLDAKPHINQPIFSEQYYFKINTDIIEPLCKLEAVGIYTDVDCFKKHFTADTYNGYVYSQYNIHTLTGRPSNRFGGVNYAALNIEDGTRNSFISRFGANGTLVLIDYSAFHPRIICELTGFTLPADVTNFYDYIARLCFKKDSIDEQDILDAKLLTFRQLYGGIEDEYAHIQFFYNLKAYVNEHWTEFLKKGYTTTPFLNRKITVEQLKAPTPYKLFNYILQFAETEIVVPLIGTLTNRLKNTKSKPILYTYDSVLFDIYNDEFDIIYPDIIDIMKDNNRFPVKCYRGNSYGTLARIM